MLKLMLYPVVKLSPHPQLPFEFGLLNTNSDLRNQEHRHGTPSWRLPSRCTVR